MRWQRPIRAQGKGDRECRAEAVRTQAYPACAACSCCWVYLLILILLLLLLLYGWVTQVSQAMCTLLSIVLPRVPNAVLRAKFVGATTLMSTLLSEHKDQVGDAGCHSVVVMVSACGTLGRLLMLTMNVRVLS